MQPYQEAEIALPTEIRNFYSLIRDNPEQSGQMKHVEILLASWKKEIAHREIDLVKSNRDREAISLVKTRRGKMKIDLIRQTFDEIRLVEEGLKLERHSAMSANTMKLAWVLIILFLFFLLTFFGRLKFRRQLEIDRALLFVREKEAREESERNNQKKDEFLGTLSHELRTPLTTILSWAQLLRTGRLDSEKSKRGIEILEESAKAEAQLIDDLLDISRIQAGKLTLVYENIDPRKVVSNTIDLVANLAATKTIQIETDFAQSVETLSADPYFHLKEEKF